MGWDRTLPPNPNAVCVKIAACHCLVGFSRRKPQPFVCRHLLIIRIVGTEIRLCPVPALGEVTAARLRLVLAVNFVPFHVGELSFFP